MIEGFMKIWRSVGYALSGLRHALSADKSFRLEVFWGLPVYLLIAWVLAPLDPTEWILFWMTYMLILIVELINSSLETMLERLHPEAHDTIGRSKDIAAAAVLLSFVFAALVIGILYLSNPGIVFQEDLLIPFA